jgi:hypothetical protein
MYDLRLHRSIGNKWVTMETKKTIKSHNIIIREYEQFIFSHVFKNKPIFAMDEKSLATDVFIIAYEYEYNLPISPVFMNTCI